MARISLRAYNEEIETLIEKEAIEEAVAHCRHILSIFPKHVATYRLLGKAYLEGHQHTEALDVFQRLLSAIPDDFIAHLGMSIIREEEGNLDAAIWHMERAFEIQPYNNAIQDEMRRLYDRRDGAAPVKIRLTHGALARMYARGHLYEQALAEAHKVLSQTPQRTDMQLLRAQMYEKLNKPVQAAEVCSLLLKKFPYCLDANRILADIILASKGEDEARVYHTHLQALDPYYAFINPEAPSLSDIPDQAVQLEKFVYQPGGLVPAAQENTWLTSIGVEESALALPGEEALPDWLTGDDSTPEKPQAQEPAQDNADAIPDWMKAAGWGPDSGTFDEASTSSVLLDEEAEGEGMAATPATLPDWLQEIAPTEIATGMLTTPTTEDNHEEDEALAALIDTGSLHLPESKQAAPAEELPDWLSDLGGETPDVGQPSTEAEPLAEAEELPDWLSDLGGEMPDVEQPTTKAEPLAEAEELPDWLSDLGGEMPDVEQPPTEAEPSPVVGQPSAEPGLEAPPDFEDMDAAMAWLEGLAAKQGAKEEELLTKPEERTAEAPDWVQEMAQETVDDRPLGEETVDGRPLTVEAEAPSELEELPDWLSDLGGETTGVGEPPTEAEPLAEAEELPDWLSDLGGETPDVGQPPTEAEPSAVVGQPSAEPGLEAPPDFEDMDAAMAWLEGLAAKQGAKEEELLTKPEERTAEAPDWVQEMAQETVDDRPLGEETVDGRPLTVEAEAPSELEELPDWLSDLGGETPDVGQPSTEAEPLAEAEELPDWLSDLGGETPDVGQPPTEAEPSPVVGQPSAEPGLEAPPDFEDMDAAMAWLEGLAAKQGAKEEELLTKPEERTAEAPDWVQEMAQETVDDRPLGEETVDGRPLTVEAEAPSELEELPDWLSDLGGETPDVGQPPTEAEPSAVVGQPSAEPGLEAPPDFEDMDAAMAWLEGLAAKQGAKEEELLTKPEERTAEAPDWVQEMAQETVDDRPLGEETVDGRPLTVEAEAPSGEEAEPLAVVGQPPAETETTGYGQPPTQAEPSASEEVGMENAQTGILPPPPAWVLEGEAPEEESTATPVSWDQSGKASIEKIDLNQASLVQLERLPGIGFRLAQAITTYRDAHGPFSDVSELEAVAGIGPMTIAELRNFLYVTPPADKPHRRPPTGMPLPDAQLAIESGAPEDAARILQPVIRSNSALDETIHTLRQALHKYPDNFELWQALGDACLRADRLEEALDAYNQAEEILTSNG